MHLYSLNHVRKNIANQKYDIFIKPKGITLVSPCRLGECCTTQVAKSSAIIVNCPFFSSQSFWAKCQTKLFTYRKSVTFASFCLQLLKPIFSIIGCKLETINLKQQFFSILLLFVGSMSLLSVCFSLPICS